MTKSGCKWCYKEVLNNDLPFKPGVNGNMGIASLISDLGIVILHNNLSAGWIEIKYCPLCGRKLGGDNDD